MKIIILLCTAILLGGCSLVELAQQVPALNDVDGVIKCISDKAASLADATPEGFCGKDIAENRECYSNFHSLSLCLLNNKCLFHKDDTTVTISS
jgi:prenyltransferase beta subunit